VFVTFQLIISEPAHCCPVWIHRCR